MTVFNTQTCFKYIDIGNLVRQRCDSYISTHASNKYIGNYVDGH